MKSIILSMLFVSSLANARLICSNENQQTQTQTLLVIDGNTLGAICQRSLNPNAPKKSNEEICAQDMFVVQSSSSSSGKVITNHLSSTTGVVLVTEISSSQSTLELNSNYQVSTLKGGNKVVLSSGKITLTCK